MSCYLIASEASGGSLFSQWSESPVDGSLCSFKPLKPVPKWKFTTNGGKTELVRNANRGVGIKEFYRGFCIFVKMAVPFESEFTHLSDEVAIFVDFHDKVKKVAKNTPISLVGCTAVAAVHADNQSLAEGNMDSASFVTRANMAGSALFFQ